MGPHTRLTRTVATATTTACLGDGVPETCPHILQIQQLPSISVQEYNHGDHPPQFAPRIQATQRILMLLATMVLIKPTTRCTPTRQSLLPHRLPFALPVVTTNPSSNSGIHNQDLSREVMLQAGIFPGLCIPFTRDHQGHSIQLNETPYQPSVHYSFLPVVIVSNTWLQ